MATLNISNEQKARFVKVMPAVIKATQTSLSQAQVFEIATALLEDKYK